MKRKDKNEMKKIQELDDMLEKLKDLREKAGIARMATKAAELALKSHILYEEFNQAAEQEETINLEIKDLELKIKGLVIDDFNLNGQSDKNYGPVQVKIFKKAVYLVDTAIEYCVDHKLLSPLKLNIREFDDISLKIKPDFVEIKEEPKAQISSIL